ncbi:MAG: recombination protein RecR [Opitutaceae bacterium]|nr:recombination protein RecR [Opitutaceae bacterium]|tara:strand:- start:6672 stop:7271 length:600 start_codon:yes stop_codon:yes gene_type:complete
MTPTFDHLVKQLKKLPGLGFRSAERIALNVLVEKPENLTNLVEALESARLQVKRCSQCGNLSEEEICDICSDERRDVGLICVVEQVPDLVAIESSGSFKGQYHVLHGKLSPIKGVGPSELNLESLEKRISQGQCFEIVLALGNDIEGEATCHYIVDTIVDEHPLKVTRIGFGLPSGGNILYADQITLKSAMDGRRSYES